MGAVEIEHRADPAVRADDLRVATRGDDLVAKLQQERGSRAVERVHRRQIERQVCRRGTGQAPHVLPRGEALPEAELAGEAQLVPAVRHARRSIGATPDLRQRRGYAPCGVRTTLNRASPLIILSYPSAARAKGK